MVARGQEVHMPNHCSM